MKTIFGITYAQLNNLTAEEINEYMAAFTLNQMRANMKNMSVPGGEKMDPGLVDKICNDSLHDLVEVMNGTMTEDMFAKMRLIYDTEEKFNLGSEMAAVAQELPVKIQPFMEKIFDTVSKHFDGLED